MSRAVSQKQRLWSSIERNCLFLLERKNSRATLLQIHAFIIQNSLQTNLNLVTKFITSLTSSDQHWGAAHARKVFDKMPQQSDAFLCNTMIKTHLSSGQFLESVSLYASLRRCNGLKPDNYTFSSLTKCCGLSSWRWEGMQIHAHVVKFGFVSNLYVATSLVDMYGKLGLMCLARLVFDEMSERSSVTWTSLMSGYVRGGKMDTAEELFGRMAGNEKDSATFNVLIDGYVKLGEMGKAKVLFDAMLEKNVVSWTTMIDGYCGIGDVDAGRSLFDMMPERNLYSWNAMIGGYCRNEQSHEAVMLFRELLSLKTLEPDDVTVVSVLPAIAVLGALDLGNSVYEYVKRKKLDRSANVCTALVDMYAKCGDVTKAKEVFNVVKGKGTCTWNALINGLALNGCAKDALEVFLEMRRKGLKPNEITLLGVLSACNHGGLVDEGKAWFDKMKEFGLTPRIEHYGCLVDLMGRAGRLEQAERLIKSMPFEANGIILSSFLFACGYANDVDRAERVVKKAIQMEPCNDGNYIMLRNLYAGERRWTDVEEIKKLMQTKGAKKEKGCSTVEINSKLQEFIAGDKIHPHLKVTHMVLGQLQMHMKGQQPYFTADYEA